MAKIWILLPLIIISICGFSQDVKLPDPETSNRFPLSKALSERKSTRSFSQQPIIDQTLANLLWSANGYNRWDDWKKTAPSSMNYQEIGIYCATKDGLYFWNPERNILEMKIPKDLRAETGKQQFCATAHLNIIFVADMAYVKENNEAQLRASYANCGFISQNIYLFCAANNLGTVVRSSFNNEKLRKAMKLEESEIIILCQTVGHYSE